MRQKAAVLFTLRRVDRTPPGSESGASVYGGNSGTRESQLFPDVDAGRRGVPADQETWRCGGILRPPNEPATGHKAREHIRYRSASEEHSAREGRLAVVVEHSTERQVDYDGEGGELRPNGPTVGKATPGTTCAGWKGR
jgi:hypothetical protein